MNRQKPSRAGGGYGGGMAQYVDWDLAAATAAALGRTGPQVSYDEAVEVVNDLRQLTDEAAGYVLDYTDLRPVGPNLLPDSDTKQARGREPCRLTAPGLLLCGVTEG